MDSASIHKYIKRRMKDAHRHESRGVRAGRNGDLEKKSEEEQISEQILLEVRDWLEPVLGNSPEEVCKLVKEKSTGGPLLPLSTNEPTYPEVIRALQLFTDAQLEKFLPPWCIEQYLKLRNTK